ncbi:MAG TPA: acyl carrier protein [Flavobacteriales bacterium]|nr:acyl carrier protein [Flavobacteriales bacterium]
MSTSNTLEQVNVIFRDVLDNDSLVITPETRADDVEEWDSLSHIQLIVNIEKHFKVKFLVNEIREWKNVGEMIDCINRKLPA